MGFRPLASPWLAVQKGELDSTAWDRQPWRPPGAETPQTVGNRADHQLGVHPSNTGAARVLRKAPSLCV